MQSNPMTKSFAKRLTGILVASTFPTTLWAYDLGAVSTGSGGSAQNQVPVDAAPAVAPTQGSLTATEPQSVISQQFLENTQTGMSNYIEAAGIAPGVWSYSPNGPGGNDNPGLSVRGFQDGQYNVLFDGIPFSDGADFTHHATSYMTNEDTGSVIVDRGPGRASTIGDATFGGTIYTDSKNPLSDPGATVRLQQGSFDSRLTGFQFDTGVMQNYGDTSAFIDYNHYTTDGALTNSSMRRSNFFAKLIKPLSDNTTLTLVAMQNDSYQHASLGATSAQIAQYGSNYGLNLDPTNQAYVGYNSDHFTSNLDYIDLKSRQDNWLFDNKLYTNSYAHMAMQAADPNGATPNGTVNGANNIPGVTGLTQYTSYGDVFKAVDSLGNDDLGMGLWAERQIHHSWNNQVDLTTGSMLSGNGTPGNEETSALNTFQPYVEYVWRPNDQWAITPGVKFDDINRTQLLVGTYSNSATYTAVLPSLDVHYYLNDHWSAYGQAAEGFVAPLLSYLGGADPASIAPQKTNNYQIGTVFKTRELTLSGDFFYITNNNLIQQVSISPGGLPVYQNAGAVQYRGIEGEATYSLGSGFNLYGNYSFEETSAAAATPILNAPMVTSAAGLLYNQGAANASLIAKEIGSRITGQDAFNNNVTLGSYTVVNFAAGYKLGTLDGWARNSVIQFQIDNVFNRTDIIAQNGRTGTSTNPAALAGDPLFWTLYGRIYNLNLSTTF